MGERPSHRGGRGLKHVLEKGSSQKSPERPSHRGGRGLKLKLGCKVTVSAYERPSHRGGRGLKHATVHTMAATCSSARPIGAGVD